MAFQRDAENNVLAFAEAEDIFNLDQRLFEANEISFAESGTGATQLRQQVTSPGGTTEAALNTFEQLGLEATFRAAMRSALTRAEEMATDFSAQHELGD